MRGLAMGLWVADLIGVVLQLVTIVRWSDENATHTTGPDCSRSSSNRSNIASESRVP